MILIGIKVVKKRKEAQALILQLKYISKCAYQNSISTGFVEEPMSLQTLSA